MPRNRITEKGKLKQNRGRGHGDEYIAWVRGGDFPNPTGVTRPTMPGLDRAFDLFPPHEPTFFYQLLWRKHTLGDITDIREQFKLPIEKTLEICQRKRIKHPQSKKEYKHITVDYWLDVVTNEGRDWYEAYDIVTEMTLNTDWREIELLEVRRTYCGENGVPYDFLTEHQLNKTLSDNVKLILKGWELRDYPNLTMDDLRVCEPELFSHLKESTVAFRHVARSWDQRLGLSPGSTLTMIWYFLWHQIWKVDMNQPLSPQKSPLLGLERIGWPQ